MGLTQIATVALVQVGPCSECGVMYAIPDNLQRARRENGGTFWCPNGHGPRTA